MSIKLIKYMESIKEFIVNNWQYISTVLVAILTVIFSLIRKKKVVIEKNLTDSFYSDIINQIDFAEKTYIKGVDKLNHVINFMKEKYPNVCLYIDETANNPWRHSSESTEVITYLVEKLLSLPQKKGVSDGKKTTNEKS